MHSCADNFTLIMVVCLFFKSDISEMSQNIPRGTIPVPLYIYIFLQFLEFYIYFTLCYDSRIKNNWGIKNDKNLIFMWWWFECNTSCIYWVWFWRLFEMFSNRYISQSCYFWCIRWRDGGIYDCNEVTVNLRWRTWAGEFYITPWCLNNSNGWNPPPSYNFTRVIAWLIIWK